MNDSIENILNSQQEVGTDTNDATDTVDTQPIQQQPVAHATDKERNFGQLREKLDRYESRTYQLERERDELMRKLQSMEQKPQQEEHYEPIDENDLVTGKKLSNYTNKLKSELEQMKRQMSEYQQQSATKIADAQLRSDYPDIHEVVTEENVRALSRANPSFAALLNSSNDYYSKASSAYSMIKAMGIHNPEGAAQKERIMNNLQKPRPASSIAPKTSMSPITQVANGFDQKTLTPELRKSLWSDMKRYASEAPSFSFHPVNQ